MSKTDAKVEGGKYYVEEVSGRDYDGKFCRVVNDRRVTIARCDYKSSAARIVTALNSQAELVGALKDVRGCIKERAGCLDCLEQIDAALAKVEGGGQ